MIYAKQTGFVYNFGRGDLSEGSGMHRCFEQAIVDLSDRGDILEIDSEGCCKDFDFCWFGGPALDLNREVFKRSRSDCWMINGVLFDCYLRRVMAVRWWRKRYV